MGLHGKIASRFLGVVVLLAILGYAGLSQTLRPAFDELESRESLRDLIRARNGIESERLALMPLSEDWAQWDETYTYVRGENPGYVEYNLDEWELIGLNTDLVLIFDHTRQLVFGTFVDLVEEIYLSLDEVELDQRAIDSIQNLDYPESVASGLIDSGLGPIVIVARPITTTDASAPVAGTFVFGRLLNDARMVVIRERAEVAMELAAPTEHELRTQSSGIFGTIEQRVDGDARISSQVLFDVLGRPIRSLMVTSTREVSALGQNTFVSLILLFAGLAVFSIFVLSLILHRTVLQPLSTLRSSMTSIAEKEDVSIRVGIDRDDEIGDLAESFDDMLEKLERMKQQNIEKSFKAGMAEVAAGVLHNVRNSLMPVMSSISTIRNAMMSRSRDNVTKAIGELSDPGTDSARREKLLEYLRESDKRSVRNRDRGAEELGSALDQLDRTADILKEQEQFSHVDPVIETIRLGDVVSDALGVVPSETLENIDINVAESVHAFSVRAQRVVLMQIIGNLLTNAVESISASEQRYGQVDIEATEVDGAPEPRVVLTVRDDGSGIDPANMDRVFERGYTTKDRGGGLGLHWSANAVAAMGGNISVSSGGVGDGAVFSITLEPATRE